MSKDWLVGWLVLLAALPAGAQEEPLELSVPLPRPRQLEQPPAPPAQETPPPTCLPACVKKSLTYRLYWLDFPVAKSTLKLKDYTTSECRSTLEIQWVEQARVRTELFPMHGLRTHEDDRVAQSLQCLGQFLDVHELPVLTADAMVIQDLHDARAPAAHSTRSAP